MQKAIRIAGLRAGEGAGIQTGNRISIPFRSSPERVFCAHLHRYRRLKQQRSGGTCAVWLRVQAIPGADIYTTQPEKENLS